MEIFLLTETWVALATLTFLEIVLGVDNIIFISILSNKLPEHQQGKARVLGLSFAMLFRIGLLLGISYIIRLNEPLLSVIGFELSGKDLILAFGGLFLLFKSTLEIHHKMEGKPEEIKANSASSMARVIFQIILLDIIFSFDSILTAVGLVDQVLIMIVAVVLAMIVMMVSAGKISKFINQNPTLQILALSFLILIGFMLLVEGLHVEVPKGYIYFAVFFSLSVELVNMRIRNNQGKKVELNPRITQK
ncbi:TerC family protein [Mongoliibacter ruber]|uniref:Putative tellurium resistance membrane protein TerC n=1 Tax=Mongoliibacter ruber TaxID=1750599 RepID=A0A2T0WPL6_9BACT|nr:TerC family protein [Mongoliibacter ruber]PRY88632.1 putative tellurium resistance membrane protein TerC [Mongoliibacter ruber]